MVTKPAGRPLRPASSPAGVAARNPAGVAALPKPPVISGHVNVANLPVMDTPGPRGLDTTPLTAAARAVTVAMAGVTMDPRNKPGVRP